MDDKKPEELLLAAARHPEKRMKNIQGGRKKWLKSF
jgi:hypothetical protein